MSLKVLDKIASAGAVMFSPANTSDQFTCYKDQGMYFRTAPPDTLQSQALAQTMAADGVQRVSILALNDPYGTGLAANTKKNLEAGGIPADQIQTIIYDPNAQSFNAEIDQIKDFKPDGVAVIAVTTGPFAAADLAAAGGSGHGDGSGRCRTRCGHQNHLPISAAIDGVMNDRITSVSNSRPSAIVVPT